MIIKIDTREHELTENINHLITIIPAFKDLKVEVSTLPIGDIIIFNEETKEDLLVIERKSVNDLLASIKDGRYEEQSYRLNGLNHHNHNIIYLIEGDVARVNRFKDNKLEKLTLYSAIFSLNYFKGFSVLRTFTMNETGIFICNTANKLVREQTKKAFYKIENNSVNEESTTSGDQEGEMAGGSDKDYVNVVKKVKKENVTPDNIGEIMLCQIPGISSVTALAIMDKFKTIVNLIECLQKDDNCLKDITYNTSKNQTRKINKTCVESIRKYLLHKEN